MDVAKVDRDVAYTASVLKACCKRLFKVFHLFQIYIASVFVWMLYMFHTYVAKSMFQMFQQFYSYVAVSVFMLPVFYLNVAYISHIYCKCMQYNKCVAF
jgi:hypothetical protein